MISTSTYFFANITQGSRGFVEVTLSSTYLISVKKEVNLPNVVEKSTNYNIMARWSIDSLKLAVATHLGTSVKEKGTKNFVKTPRQ